MAASIAAAARLRYSAPCLQLRDGLKQTHMHSKLVCCAHTEVTTHKHTCWRVPGASQLGC